MLTDRDLLDMFHEHLDSKYETIVIEDFSFFPSEVLEQFPNAYGKAFESYLDEIGAEWIQTEEDGYYKLNNMFEEEI